MGEFVYNGAPIYGQLTKKAGDNWHFNRSDENVVLFGEMFRSIALIMNFFDHIFRPAPPASAGGDSRPVDQGQAALILQTKSKQRSAAEELCKNTFPDHTKPPP